MCLVLTQKKFLSLQGLFAVDLGLTKNGKGVKRENISLSKKSRFGEINTLYGVLIELITIFFILLLVFYHFPSHPSRPWQVY